MWNEEKSIALSKWCILLFLGLLIAAVVLAPWLTRWFVGFSSAGLQGRAGWFMATIYGGALPAGYLLFSLLALVRRIDAGQVFINENVESLRRISWCCFLGAVAALGSAVYYLPWFFVAVAAAFMGLIVRVLKNVFEQAVELKNEAEYTV